MAPIVIIFILIFAGGGILGTDWYLDNYTGLQLENPIPSSMTIEVGQTKNIEYKIHSYDNEQVWNDVKVEIELENSSDKFLKTSNTSHGSLILGKDSKKNLLMEPFRAIKSEGYRLTYDGNLIASANNRIEDIHSIDITIIEPNSYSKINTKVKNGDIRFENFNDNRFTLDVGEEDIITFQIQSYENKVFDNITVDVFIENHSGKYLQIKGTSINEKLEANGDITGIIEIPIKALSSEGSELRYKINFGLYDDSVLMDVETIDVGIIGS